MNADTMNRQWVFSDLNSASRPNSLWRRLSVLKFTRMRNCWSSRRQQMESVSERRPTNTMWITSCCLSGHGLRRLCRNSLPSLRYIGRYSSGSTWTAHLKLICLESFQSLFGHLADITTTSYMDFPRLTDWEEA